MEAVACLFGAGGHGRVVAAQLWRFHKTACLFADANRDLGTTVSGMAVVGQAIADVVQYPLLITIGDNGRRAALQREAEGLGARMMAIVMEPTVYMAETAPGPGSQVLAGALVNTGALIGRGVIINSRAVVEHDARVGDFCHLAPGSVIGGGVQFGEQVFLGTNATVLPGISVASGAVIGAGAVVTRDITRPGTYVGVPAKALASGGAE